jgi:hypothetical protein
LVQLLKGHNERNENQGAAVNSLKEFQQKVAEFYENKFDEDSDDDFNANSEFIQAM